MTSTVIHDHSHHYHYHHHHFNKILFTIGTDFVMHNTSIFSNTDNGIADCFWHVANDSFFLWLISEPNSCYRLRQVAASAAHFHRFCATSFISMADYGATSLFSSAVSSDTFSVERSKLRAFKRLMLTLHRNGGVYRDLYEIIEAFAHFDPVYENVLKAQPFTSDGENQGYLISRDEAAVIIQSELGKRATRNFVGFPLRPTSSRNEISQFECNLKDGQRVTVSIMPPHLERMRKYDLVPFKMIKALFDLTPVFQGEKSLFEAILGRLDKSLEKEVLARRKILTAFGVDFNMASSDIIKSAKNVDLPISIPAPLPHLCSQHVMVTSVEPKKRMKQCSSRITMNLSSFTSQIYKKAGFIVPNIGISNVRVRKDEVSLASFASLVKIDPKKVEAAGNLYSAILLNDRAKAIRAAQSLKISRENAKKVLKKRKGQLTRMTFELLPENAEFVLAGGETMVGLASHVSSSTARAVRSMMSAADFVSSLFNDYALHFIE